MKIILFVVVFDVVVGVIVLLLVIYNMISFSLAIMMASQPQASRASIDYYTAGQSLV